MKTDYLVWVGCALLFIAGVIWSPIILGVASADFNFASMKETLECISYFATVAACLAAIFALKSWRIQFIYNKKFDCLARLKLASDNIKCAARHVRFFTRVQIRAQGLVSGDFPKLEANASEVEEAWVSADKEMGRAIDECELFVESKYHRELFLLHEQLSQVVRGYEYRFFDLLEERGVAVNVIHKAEKAASAECDQKVIEIQKLVRSLRSQEFASR